MSPQALPKISLNLTTVSEHRIASTIAPEDPHIVRLQYIDGLSAKAQVDQRLTAAETQHLIQATSPDRNLPPSYSHRHLV
jgi:hypothetical protein